MKNIKLILEYDGKNFCGWQKQKQKHIRTIQGAVEHSIKALTGEDVEAIGCSRTDTGVHAKEFVLNFYTNSTIPGDKFSYALNNRLPEDIVVLMSEEVEQNFHSRYNSKGKTYCYTILNRRTPTAINRNYTYLVKEKLDIEKMTEAAKYLIGTHDFEAFRTIGSSVKTTIRTIYDINIEKVDEKINIYVSGDGFLYNMVRIIVGTLIKVGRGKLEPSSINEILENKDRSRTGKVVPPTGLTLLKVFY